VSVQLLREPFSPARTLWGRTSFFSELQPDEWAETRSGDPAAFGALFETHHDRVLWHALRSVGSFHDAEDVAALVFLEAWRKRESVRVVNGSVLPWLLVTTNYVARNFARARRRHRHAMETLPGGQHHDDFSTGVNERLDDEPRRVAVRQAFATLTGVEQDVVSLCVIQGMTVLDASTALGVPVGTVKSRLFRSKKKLAELVTDMTDASIPGDAR
jgi:RNA polymerase sigma factor (sigma-70 family)